MNHFVMDDINGRDANGAGRRHDNVLKAHRPAANLSAFLGRQIFGNVQGL